MKKLIALLFACLLAGLTGYSQKVAPERVPAPVRQSFAKKFPAAADVSYEREKKDYEINFKDKGVAMSANFDPYGKWLETETEIKEADLPKEVAAAVAKFYKGYQVSEVTQTESLLMGMSYEMDMKKESDCFEIRFSPEGFVLKKTPLKKK